MATQPQDKYAQMQSKLREGLQILSQASSEDGYQLGVALLKLHAALEDYFRLEIAKRAPSLRMEVDDPKKTSWNELIRYGKQYLRLTEEDARIIVEANRQRMSVAHGGNYEKNRQELVKYAGFVERWCNQGKPVSSEPRPRFGTILRPSYQPPPPPPPTAPRSGRTPWYRSRPFFFLIFFLLPPLWAVLILTERRQTGWIKLIAGGLLSLEVFIVLFLLNPASTLFPNSLRRINDQIVSPFPSLTASGTPEDAPPQSTTPILSTVTPLSNTNEGCTVVWVEVSSDKLAGKNPAMVWAEIVLPQVNGSGMTSRQFYDQVLERNPELVRDGYEFKKGKTYWLPTCP